MRTLATEIMLKAAYKAIQWINFNPLKTQTRVLPTEEGSGKLKDMEKMLMTSILSFPHNVFYLYIFNSLPKDKNSPFLTMFSTAIYL